MRITQLSAKKPTKEFIEVLREKNRGKEKKIVCNIIELGTTITNIERCCTLSEKGKCIISKDSQEEVTKGEQRMPRLL